MLDEIPDSVSQLPGVFLFYNESGLALVYDVGDAALVCADARQPLLHGFKQDERETFVGVIGGENKDVGILKKPCFFFAVSLAEIEDEAKFYPPIYNIC